MNIKDDVKLGIYPNFPYTIVNEKNDVEISIGIADRVLYITFLGSITTKDWIHDFMFWKWGNRLVKPYKNMKHIYFAHYGFLKIYKLCQDTVHEWLHKTNEYDSILITGHSLGAAVTTLCLEDVQYLQDEKLMPEKKVTAVTSGAPRVFGLFNHKLLKKRCRNLLRVIFKDDVIPSLPPAILGYRHVGVVYQVGERIINIFNPSVFYNHDPLSYMSMDENYPANKDSNWFYENAVNVYNKIVYPAIIILSIPVIAILVYVLIKDITGL